MMLPLFLYVYIKLCPNMSYFITWGIYYTMLVILYRLFGSFRVICVHFIIKEFLGKWSRCHQNAGAVVSVCCVLLCFLLCWRYYSQLNSRYSSNVTCYLSYSLVFSCWYYFRSCPVSHSGFVPPPPPPPRIWTPSREFGPPSV